MSAEFEDQVPALSPEALLILVGNLSSDKFEALRTAVHSTEAYASPKPRCTKLAAVLEIPANRVKALLSVLDQIYDIVNDAEAEWPTSLADVVNSFRHLTSLQGSEAAKLKSLILKRLTLLTDRNEAAERLSKLARLRSGLIKNAVAFSSLVDLRPDFSADRKAMNGLIPTIQVRITTDATPAKDREFVFQMSLSQLDDLEKFTADIRSKVNHLMTNSAIAQLIIREAHDEAEGE